MTIGRTHLPSTNDPVPEHLAETGSNALCIEK